MNYLLRIRNLKAYYMSGLMSKPEYTAALDRLYKEYWND